MLPPRMKSGRELVAVNEDRTIGLYGSVQEGYRVLLADRTVSYGMARSDRPYPGCPDGKWFWRAGVKPKPRKQRNSKRQKDIAFREAMTASAASKNVERPVSASQICVDCERNVTKFRHSHTLGHPASALCCHCARARGVICKFHEEAKAEREALATRDRAARGRASGSKGPKAAREAGSGRKRR